MDHAITIGMLLETFGLVGLCVVVCIVCVLILYLMNPFNTGH